MGFYIFVVQFYMRFNRILHVTGLFSIILVRRGVPDSKYLGGWKSTPDFGPV